MKRILSPSIRSILAVLMAVSAISVFPKIETHKASADNSPTLFFEDDFSNSKSGWPTADSDIGSAAYKNGIYEISIKRPEFFFRPSNKYIKFSSKFVMEVDVTMVSGDNNGQTGIQIKLLDKDKAQLEQANYATPPDYFFYVYPAAGTATLFNRRSDVGIPNRYSVSGPGVILTNNAYSAINSGKKTNHLTLAFQDNRIIASINDVKLVDAKDDSIGYIQKLIDEGLINSATVSLVAGKYEGATTSIFQFDNFRYYYGNYAAIVAPIFLKDNSVLNDKVNYLKNKGFIVNDVYYYTDLTKDLDDKLKTCCATNPVQTMLICDISEKAAVRSHFPSTYKGDINIVDINLVGLSVSEFIPAKTAYQPGYTCILKTTITNTGLVDFNSVSIKYSAVDSSGSAIYSNEIKLDPIAKGGKRDIEIHVPFSPFTANGRYKVDTVITANAKTGETTFTTEKKTSASIQVSGQSPLLFMLIVGLIVVAAGITGFVIYRNKKKKPEKTVV